MPTSIRKKRSNKRSIKYTEGKVYFMVKMNYKLVFVFISFLFIFVVGVNGVFPQSGQLQSRDSRNNGNLEGIREIGVQITGDVFELEKYGLRQKQIQTDIELKLRKVGLVVKEMEFPSLELYIKARAVGNEVIVTSLLLQFRELAEIKRNSIVNKQYVISWSLLKTGAIQESGISKMREAIGDMVDLFCNDILRDNPIGSQNNPRGKSDEKYKRYVGKYPSEFFKENPKFLTKVKNLLGRDFELFQKNSVVESQIEYVDSSLILEGCRPHDCGDERIILIIVFPEETIHCAIKSSERRNNISIFSEDKDHLPTSLKRIKEE